MGAAQRERQQARVCLAGHRQHPRETGTTPSSEKDTEPREAEAVAHARTTGERQGQAGHLTHPATGTGRLHSAFTSSCPTQPPASQATLTARSRQGRAPASCPRLGT